jgi:hypothetical protein
MLTSDQLDALTLPVLALYTDYENSVILDIARRLGKMGDVTATAAWQMQRLTESGRVYESALSELSILTGKTRAELRAMFAKAGVKALEFDDAIYRKAGLNPLPLNLSPAMIEVLKAGLVKTQGVMQNLTLTTAITGQRAFENAADLAYMQVTGGAMSYDEAIRAAVKKVAADGISVINYAGRTDQLDVAMRRTVLTGVGQAVGELQMARAEEMGADLVATSAHAGARPEHQVWQGKIFSRSGTNPKYPPFVESTGYGKVDGLAGINCRHSFMPFYAGISQNAYNAATLDEMNDKTVKLGGKDIPMYEATQIQRGIERKIRYWKRQAAALSAAGLDNSKEIAQVKGYQAQMRGFISEINKHLEEQKADWRWQRQSVREQI